MYIGFMSIHPVTVPLGNDVAFTLGSVFSYGFAVYTGLIKPELTQVLSVIDLI